MDFSHSVGEEIWIGRFGNLRVEDILTPAPATPASVAVSVGTIEQLNDIVIFKFLLACTPVNENIKGMYNQ